MQPIRSIYEIRINWKNYKKKWKNKLYGIFLYTELDKDFKKSIEENFWELDSLSGKDALLFVINEIPVDIQEKYTKINCRNRFGFEKASIQSVNNDKTDVYKIAKKVGVLNKLPCLILYKDIPTDKNLEKSICISFKNFKLDIINEFREIFSKIQDCNTSEENLMNIRKYIDKKKKNNINFNLISENLGIFWGTFFKKFFGD